MQTKYIPASANNSSRGRGDEKIDLIICHWSAAEPLSAIDTKFVDQNRLASVHYGIENNEVHQYVKDEDTAFHAGSAAVDKKSIGIIIVGGVNMPITDASYQTLALLIEELARKYRLRIDADHIKGHNSVSNGRCPGTLDIARVITDAKKLSPQTIIERLRMEKDEMEEKLKTIEEINGSFNARVEELRDIIREKDLEIVTKSEDIVYMTIKCVETESELEKSIGETLQVRSEITHLYRKIAEQEKLLSKPLSAIFLERFRKVFKK